MTLDELEQAYRVTEDVRERITEDTIFDMENGDPLVINSKLELIKEILHRHDEGFGWVKEGLTLTKDTILDIDNDLSRLEDFTNKQAERVDLLVELCKVQNDRIAQLEGRRV